MLFNSFDFLKFGVIFFVVYFFIKDKFWRKILLLAASYYFYSCWDYRFTFLLIWSTLIDYFTGLKIDESSNDKKRKRLLIISVVNNLAILGFFKYYNFFLGSLTDVLNQIGVSYSLPALKIILPVGISFYTFQTMSYTIDIYKKKMSSTRSILDFSLFVSFFPQLVAGPIERAQKLLPQIAELKKPSKTDIQEGLGLLLNGFVRKVVISDVLSGWVDKYFLSDISSQGLFDSWTGLILFSFQIYFDFSGYSLIARGLSRIMGIELMKNFNTPYFAKGMSGFWKRWHISLSEWLRDYLYIPLGGNRGSLTRTQINLLITMLIGGLWHGASWNFVLWGGLHGFYLVFFRVINAGNKTEGKWVVFLTYFLVLLTWLPFRAPDLSYTFDYYKSMINFDLLDINQSSIVYLVYTISLWLLIDIPTYRNKSDLFFFKYSRKLKTMLVTLSILAVFFVMFLQKDSIKPFIYFQF